MPDTLVRPAYLWVPDHVSTSGGEAADLAASVGMHLDAEQRLALDAILAERPDGRWAAFEAAIAASRQNLKTYVFKAAVLADLWLFDVELAVWTAHEFNTAVEAFRDFKLLIESYPFLSRRVKRIDEANGEEGVEFMTNQRLRFKARTKTGGRGLTAPRLILDEAQELTAKMIGSLMPLMSALSMTGNPQLLYGGSAGNLGSEVWRGVRNRGRAGGAPRLAWIEWATPVRPCENDRCDHRPRTPGCVLDDREAWQEANPAMGRRIDPEFIQTERDAMTPEEFARERLGWWEEPEAGTAGLPLELWAACARPPFPGDTLALAVDVTPDFAWTSVARSVAAPWGIGLEVLAHRRGTSWAAPFVTNLGWPSVPLVIDRAGPASVVADDLAKLVTDTEPLAPSGRDVAQGCASLLDGLIRRTVAHFDQPELNAAIAGATRRPMGDSWAWSRKSSTVDISPLVAVTLALWGATQAPDQCEPFMVVT